MASSNLYPPLTETYMPAFEISKSTNDNCKIYFSISDFNGISELADYCQVTFNFQKTNKSALAYTNSIKIADIEKDEKGYYVTIWKSDLKEDFKINQYYKVQISFVESGVARPADSNSIGKWLNDNANHFSEWSSVCLIRAISKVSINIVDFDFNDKSALGVYELRNHIAGDISFSDPSETETLRSYQIYVLNNNEIIFDSGIQYPVRYGDNSNSNQINYLLKKTLSAGTSYTLRIHITTFNYFEKDFNKIFFYFGSDTITLINDEDAGRYFILDPEEGRIGLNLTNLKSKLDGLLIDKKYYLIERANIKDGYTEWTDMEVFKYDKSAFGKDNIIWYDRYIESGVWYKYAISRYNLSGHASNRHIIDIPMMTVFEHIYLSRGDKQLKISYNPKISSFKYNTSENLVSTIGSQYPFVTRNASVFYADFPLGGTISLHSDENGLFFRNADYLLESRWTKYNGFSNNTEAEKTLNNDSFMKSESIDSTIRRDSDYDWIKEKAFREAVYDFLYQDDALLFRSPSEGNFLIKLTGISFSPNQQLGRRIYDFSSTATEIDECSFDNLYKYKIKEEIYYPNESDGEDFEFELDLSGDKFEDIINRKWTHGNVLYALAKYFPEIEENFEGYHLDNFNISDFRIEFEGGASKVDFEDDGNPENKFSDKGYQIEINNEPVFIKSYYTGIINENENINKEYGVLNLTDVNLYSIRFISKKSMTYGDLKVYKYGDLKQESVIYQNLDNLLIPIKTINNRKESIYYVGYTGDTEGEPANHYQIRRVHIKGKATKLENSDTIIKSFKTYNKLGQIQYTLTNNNAYEVKTAIREKHQKENHREIIDFPYVRVISLENPIYINEKEIGNIANANDVSPYIVEHENQIVKEFKDYIGDINIKIKEESSLTKANILITYVITIEEKEYMGG